MQPAQKILYRCVCLFLLFSFSRLNLANAQSFKSLLADKVPFVVSELKKGGALKHTQQPIITFTQHTEKYPTHQIERPTLLSKC